MAVPPEVTKKAFGFLSFAAAVRPENSRSKFFLTFSKSLTFHIFLAAFNTDCLTASLPSSAYTAPPAAVNGLAPPPATAPAPAPSNATPIDSIKFGPCCAKLATNQSIAPFELCLLQSQ